VRCAREAAAHTAPPDGIRGPSQRGLPMGPPAGAVPRPGRPGVRGRAIRGARSVRALMNGAAGWFTLRCMSQDSEIRVLIAEPREVTRRGLALVIDREPRMRTVGEAATLAAAQAAAAASGPDLVVIDGGLLGRRGADALDAMRRAAVGVRVMALVEGDPGSTDQALRAGADAVMVKRRASEELIAAIQGLCRRPLPTPMAVGPRRGAVAAVSALGPVDREVLRLVALGNSTAAIARRIGCAAAEVERRRRAVAAALGAASRADLVRLADDAGLTGPGV